MRGLVLTAGGARGAYQAGVLRRVGELRSLRGRPSPFPIVTGASAGAINGSIVGGAHSLLDTAPLRGFLARHLRLAGITKAIDAGALHAIAISATSYHSGKSFTFVQGRPGIPLWNKSRRVTLPAKLGVEHILASSAIPIVFPPVRVATDAGPLFFGDGALRLVNPLSPAIRLGASRVFAVGIRCHASAAELWEAESGVRDGVAPATRSNPRRSHRSAASS